MYHSPTVTFLLTSIEQQLVLTNICDVIEENWAIFLFSKYVCVLEKFPIRTKRLSYSYVVVQLNMSLEYMQRCWSYQNRNFSCFENSLEIWRCWNTNYFKECFYNLNFKQTKLQSKLILSKHTLCAIGFSRKGIVTNIFYSINRLTVENKTRNSCQNSYRKCLTKRKKLFYIIYHKGAGH